MTINPLKRQSINPPPTQVFYDQFHYSQATRVGDLIWVSGQVGIDSNMKPESDVAAQTHLAFQSLAKVLQAAGAGLEDVVELTTFHTRLQADMPLFASIKDEYFPSRYPSWTAVGITELALPGLVVEIRAVAVAGSGNV
ncbi:RidA family protein [Pseudomonas sp. GD03858]|uniref:RidA family protein n=1 Tax=unclassified Pseudomonas TaxID=196821 RepID=UPI00244AB201|nr:MULTISPECIES: RidA family protein [unclassified Pseudomonas]MDH0645179.1 RidA family protein [Pseudomonas sp. GD03867]MDH0660801.1 RidA family protein [Pseudomonas sp. GD03858]